MLNSKGALKEPSFGDSDEGLNWTLPSTGLQTPVQKGTKLCQTNDSGNTVEVVQADSFPVCIVNKGKDQTVLVKVEDLELIHNCDSPT